MANPTHVATGVIATGSTSAAPAYPAAPAPAAGNLLILAVTCKPDTATAPAIAGWTNRLDQSVGGGVAGAGTGPQKLFLYTKIAAGGESGTVTVTPATVASNVCLASIACYACTAGTTFDIDVSYGTQATATTSLVANKVGADREIAGDTMFFCLVTSANNAMTAETIGTNGVGFSPVNNNQDAGSTTGNDAQMSMNDRPATSGAATAASHPQATITSSTGGAAIVRMREVPVPPFQTLLAPRTGY